MIVSIAQPTLSHPVNYFPYTKRRLTEAYEMKTNGTWIYSALLFEGDVEGAQGFIFVNNRANAKPQRSIGAKYGYLLFGHGQIH